MDMASHSRDYSFVAVGVNGGLRSFCRYNQLKTHRLSLINEAFISVSLFLSVTDFALQNPSDIPYISL